MADIRLVTARQLLWDKEAWRQPAFLGFAIQMLDQIVEDDAQSSEARNEAQMLIKKLYQAGKAPRLS
jgi:hypothetical protein